MKNDTSVLYKPFDVKIHKEIFTNYLEVIINEDGSIEYAVPSHAEKVYQKYIEKYKVTREEIYRKFDFPYDVATAMKIVLVWSNRIVCEFKSNEAQERTLDMLRKEGLLNDK